MFSELPGFLCVGQHLAMEEVGGGSRSCLGRGKLSGALRRPPPVNLHARPSCPGSVLQASVACVRSFCDSCAIYIREEVKSLPSDLISLSMSEH